jgi:hypothetical protein
MGGRRHRRGGRTTPKGTRPPSRRGPTDDADDDPLDTVRLALREPGPEGLLAFASLVVEISRPEESWPEVLGGPSDDERIDRELFLAALAHDDRKEATALLAALAVLLPEDEEQITASLGGRSFDRLPAWVGELARPTVTGTWAVRQVHGGVEQVLVGLRWPGGEECCALVVVSHDEGDPAVDGALLPLGLDTVLGRIRDGLPETAGDRLDEVDPGWARATGEAAIGIGAQMVPGYETDTWPEARAAVGWALSLLPDGFELPERPEWTAEQVAEVAAEVLASPEAAELALPEAVAIVLPGLGPDPAHAGVAESLVHYATGWGAGDPLVWSPRALEIVLLDWFPRKHLMDYDWMSTLPDVLRVFVRYGGRVRGLPDEVVEASLSVIEDLEEEYLDGLVERDLIDELELDLDDDLDADDP